MHVNTTFLFPLEHKKSDPEKNVLASLDRPKQFIQDLFKYRIRFFGDDDNIHN